MYRQTINQTVVFWILLQYLPCSPHVTGHSSSPRLNLSKLVPVQCNATKVSVQSPEINQFKISGGGRMTNNQLAREHVPRPEHYQYLRKSSSRMQNISPSKQFTYCLKLRIETKICRWVFYDLRISIALSFA